MPSNTNMGLRYKVAQVLAVGHQRNRLNRIVDIALILLIVSNIIAIILESEPELHTPYHKWFFAFEAVSVAIFSVEYIARVWTCVELDEYRHLPATKARLKFVRQPLLVIDLVAILPFYLMFFFVIDLRFLRVVRLLRVFKLTRYSHAMNTMLEVLREEAKTLWAATFILFVLLILASSGIYLLEHKVQPQVYGSIPSAMWWAIVTLTTVGYGDVTPITIGGKIFGSFVALIGVGFVALPTGILASGFANALRRRRLSFEQQVDFALEDGELSIDELAELKKLQQEIGLPEEDAIHIYQLTRRQFRHQHEHCPHCGKSLLKLPEELKKELPTKEKQLKNDSST